MTARPIRSRSTEWPNDATVAQVRKARAAMWEEAGRDPRAYFDLARREPPLRVTKPARAPTTRARSTKPGSPKRRRRAA